MKDIVIELGINLNIGFGQIKLSYCAKASLEN